MKTSYREPEIDFSYAFAPPHRITLALPNSSQKTLFDLEPGKLTLSWTYDDLTKIQAGAYMVPTTPWKLSITPELNGVPFKKSSWSRLEMWLPGLTNRYEYHRGIVEFEAIGGESAAIILVTVSNTSENPQRFSFKCEMDRKWGLGFNPAWCDLDGPDVLCAGWRDRGDKVLFIGIGADEYVVPDSHITQPVWNVKPGETRRGWFIRPYHAFASELASLRSKDWENEMDLGREVWKKLIGRMCKIDIPEKEIMNALYACFADLFVMREPVQGGYISGIAGTQRYRFSEAAEPGIASVAIDQFSLHDEAESGYLFFLEMPHPPDPRADLRDSLRLVWLFSGFRAWVVMEHYYLTRDKSYLETHYPVLAATARWQESMRAKTRLHDKNGNRIINYGLMPRGVGDCGLKDDDDYFGVFLPHNIWALMADRCAVEAAGVLDKKSDLPELRQNYETAHRDLISALENGAIVEDGYRWIPGVAGKTSGSRWGALNALFPTKTLPPFHELINGTIQYLESNISPGGIPLNLGWLPDGLWTSIAVDNLSQSHLMRGEGDAAVEYLYAALNHGTPLFTWCEERGQEPGSETIAGDLQHLWTPAAVVRYLRDAMIMENEDELHLASGTARKWLERGENVGIKNAPSHFGTISYQMRYDASAMTVSGEVTFPDISLTKRAVLHLRLPDGMKATSVDPETKAKIQLGGEAIFWDTPTGRHQFKVKIER